MPKTFVVKLSDDALKALNKHDDIGSTDYKLQCLIRDTLQGLGTYIGSDDVQIIEL